jgi:hypothetical protein
VNNISHNDAPPLNEFESELLSELRAHVAHRAVATAARAPVRRADSGAGRRTVRRWVAGLAAAAVAGVATATALVGGGTVSAAAAFNVEDTADAVKVTIFDLTDEEGLQADLLAHGIEAEVDWRVDGDLPPDAPAGAPFLDDAGDQTSRDLLPKVKKMTAKQRVAIRDEWFLDPTAVPAPRGPECTGAADPATFTKSGDAWELTIPAGSLLMDRSVYLGASEAEDGVQVVVDYESARSGEFCTLILDD